MRNASGHQCKEKMSGSEKKVNAYDVSSLKKNCLDVSRCSRAEQRQRNDNDVVAFAASHYTILYFV